nr:hypothetical protein [Tanacetum cinerariifolium]
PSAGSDRGSKRQKEGGEHASASTLSETATRGAGRSTTGSQSQQLSASKSAFTEEPVQTTCQMEEPPHPMFETVNQESALDVYSKRRIIAITELKIVEWHDYKHLDWISRREAYTAHSNPRGFIYQNKDKKNRLMRIDELHKFRDGTLNDVRNALDDRLKGIRMQYLPSIIWRRGDNDRAAAMIQAIEKMLNTRSILRSLEKFVGGRLYKGDFRMLQKTI